MSPLSDEPLTGTSTAFAPVEVIPVLEPKNERPLSYPNGA